MPGSRRKTYLGWAQGVSLDGHVTGVWHAVMADGTPDPVCACTRRQYFSSPVQRDLPAGIRLCERIGCSNVLMREGDPRRKPSPAVDEGDPGDRCTIMCVLDDGHEGPCKAG